MKYSILIPLEFHRGVAVDCIRSWVVQASTLPSNAEVLVSASLDHNAKELAEIKEVLRPGDRILTCNAQHDIPLVNHAAGHANGQYLVLTESHCAPIDGFLQKSNQVLADHPDWIGFSGQSIPWTHNRLSEIEAAMYNRDIQQQLNHHPWLKVLDQCFVIQRTAYHSVGGMEEEYGHFAEWVLAARFADHGLTIGHDSRPAIRHRYCGDLDELETFTIDFAKGEIRHADHAARQRAISRFHPPLAWHQRYSFDANCLRQASQALLIDAFRRMLTRDGFRSVSRQTYPWRKLLQLIRQKYLGQDARLVLQLKMRQLKRRLRGQLNELSPIAANETFCEWIHTCAQYGYADYLVEWSSKHLHGSLDEQDPFEHTDPILRIAATELPLKRLLGFHADEVFQSGAFCWLEPLSMFRLNTRRAKMGHVVFEWASFASTSIQRQLRFYCNGRPISARQVNHCGLTTTLHFDGSKSMDQLTSETSVNITCIGSSLPSAQDVRSLSLPLIRVFWKAHSDSQTIFGRAA